MRRHRPLPRRRPFPGGTVVVNVEGDQPVGSRVQTDIGEFLLPHWPSRVKDVRSQRGGGIVVEMKNGETRFFDRGDALEEGGSHFMESSGSSMGGHSPKAHGKIRYIVRAFGKWAQGKQSVCVKRLMDEHPEVVGGDTKRANALCAWMKDQWAATTHWRGPASNPKNKARDEAIEQRAKSTAYSRFSHSMPELSNAELDLLVELMNDQRPIEDMLSELGVDPGDDPYVALFEYDAASSAAALEDATLKLRQGKDVAEAMQVWLAVHGDVRPIVEAQLPAATERVLQGDGPMVPRNELEGRVMEAMEIGRAVEPWNLKPRSKVVLHEDEAEESPEARPDVAIDLSAKEGVVIPTIVVEGDYVPSGEVGTPRKDLMRMNFDELYDRARTLYEATSEPDVAGRSYLSSCGRNELARIVERLEGAFADAKGSEDEDLTEADSNDLVSDPQYRVAKNTPGLDSPTRAKKVPTDLADITLKSPPNLRRGYMTTDRHRPRACAGCVHFIEGTCRAYGNYPVSAGELCDTFDSTHPLDEADGYMTRGGEDVGHYARIGKGSKMVLHLHPRRDGTYDESVMRMGMSRLADPDNPTSELHAGHVRIRHRKGEHWIEPDWSAHPEGEGNPELAKYATVRHGAKRAAELANSRVRRPYDGGDAITRVDSGTPGSPANAQWPIVPQIGEASPDDLAETLAAEISEKWVSWGKWKQSHPRMPSAGGRTPHGPIPRVLRVGTQGHYMHRVKNQMFSRITGHFPHATTGPGFDRAFRHAVRVFQRAHGLQVDGVVGRQTLAAIRGQRNAARIAPGALTAGDRRWLREGDVPAGAEKSADEIADLVVEQLV